MFSRLLFVAAALFMTGAGAADYFTVLPNANKPPKVPLTVTLNPHDLPTGMVAKPYTFDLGTLLSVTGDDAFDATKVTWTSPSVPMPDGLSMDKGVITGTPKVVNEDGVSFNVKATYRKKSGEQTYTLTVMGQALLAKQLSTGASSTCAVTPEGGVKCWGYCDSMCWGQLGNGSGNTSPVPVVPTGLTSGVRLVRTGNAFSCAVLENGAVTCWGANDAGQLGSGYVYQYAAGPVSSLAMGGAVDVALGYKHGCGLTTSGGVRCWGHNGYGQVGKGMMSNFEPWGAQVVGLESGVRKISAGWNHSCAVMVDGTVKCWGNNNNGQLGDGTRTDRPAPVTVPGITDAVDISVGMYHNCVIRAGNIMTCWGWGPSGEIRTNEPDIVKVATGYGNTCVITTQGAAKCWGNSQYGLTGTGSYGQTVPFSMSNVIGADKNVIDISPGETHMCFILKSGQTKCAGHYKRVGAGNLTGSQSIVSPVVVLPGS